MGVIIIVFRPRDFINVGAVLNVKSTLVPVSQQPCSRLIQVAEDCLLGRSGGFSKWVNNPYSHSKNNPYNPCSKLSSSRY